MKFGFSMNWFLDISKILERYGFRVYRCTTYNGWCVFVEKHGIFIGYENNVPKVHFSDPEAVFVSPPDGETDDPKPVSDEHILIPMEKAPPAILVKARNVLNEIVSLYRKSMV